MEFNWENNKRYERSLEEHKRGKMKVYSSDSEMLTTAEVARLLHVHPNTVRQWSNKGMIRAYRLGTRGDRRFDRKDIERFIGHE